MLGPSLDFCCTCTCPHSLPLPLLPCVQLLYPHSTVPLAEVVMAASQDWQGLQPGERGVFASRQAMVRFDGGDFRSMLVVVGRAAAAILSAVVCLEQLRA